MTIDSFFIHTLFCFLHNIHLHVILVFFLTLIFHFYLFSLMKLSRQLIPLRQISLELLIFKPPPLKKMQQNPPIFHQQKTTKTIAICLADFIFYIFKWGYLRFWLRYCFLTIKRNTWLHVERNYTTKSNIDWNLYQCNTYMNKNRTRTLST